VTKVGFVVGLAILAGATPLLPQSDQVRLALDTAVVGSLKVLDLKWPIREADIAHNNAHGSASDAKQLLRMLVLIPIKGFIGTNQNRILAS
jgi:hypothetical protein